MQWNWHNLFNKFKWIIIAIEGNIYKGSKGSSWEILQSERDWLCREIGAAQSQGPGFNAWREDVGPMLYAAVCSGPCCVINHLQHLQWPETWPADTRHCSTALQSGDKANMSSLYTCALLTDLIAQSFSFEENIHDGVLLKSNSLQTWFNESQY